MGEEGAAYPVQGKDILQDADFIRSLREQMLAFAEIQLSQRSAAEDAVQEAFIGAFKNIDSFKGKSALRTWVFAILKNKIADTIRQNKRTVLESDLNSNSDERDTGSFFDNGGSWHSNAKPTPWGDPELSFKDQQFWIIFETCLNRLPENLATVFMMREFIGLSTEEICEKRRISSSNLHVILHRARLRLRACLEHHWFGA